MKLDRDAEWYAGRLEAIRYGRVEEYDRGMWQ